MKTISVILLFVASVSAQVGRPPVFRVLASRPAFAPPQTLQPQRYNLQQLPAYRVPTAGVPSFPPNVPILRQSDIRDDRGYAYSYETGDRTAVSERGLLKSGPEGDFITAEGSFSFVGTDGVTYTITYKADENGFQASGAHIPKAAEAPSFTQKK